ncbi:hypothetical protein HN011_008872 [Eciton burchellii]|nr:hypothetical protein HN011_008872 [Eciton burchellii]
MEHDSEADKARAMRCKRRARRKHKLCRCKPKRRKRVRISSQNPFIIFYLEMYFKSPGRPVTEVAREAGKIWCSMSDEQRQKYICQAERERRRRRGRRRHRRHC